MLMVATTLDLMSSEPFSIPVKSSYASSFVYLIETYKEV